MNEWEIFLQKNPESSRRGLYKRMNIWYNNSIDSDRKEV